MKYTVYKENKPYLKAYSLDSIKDVLRELALQNFNVSYSVRLDSLPFYDPCAYFVKRGFNFEERDDVQYKQDVLKISECDGKKIILSTEILSEEEYISE
jgi:hypothetical protein